MKEKANIVLFPGQQRTSRTVEALRKGKEKAASLRAVQLIASKKWTILLVVVGFLLGRAVILKI